MIVGHGGIIEIKVLAHLGHKVQFLVDAIKAQRSQGINPKSLISYIFICLLIDLKTSGPIPGSFQLLVQLIQGDH